MKSSCKQFCCKKFFCILLLLTNASCSLIKGSAKEVILPASENISEPVIADKIGTKIDLNLTFTDAFSQKRTLGELLQGKQALLLTLNYYSCTTMCTLQFANLAQLLKHFKAQELNSIALATVSFDPLDRPAEALEKYKAWAEPLAEKIRWDFLVGNNANIIPLTKQLNFYYEYHPEDKEYAHSSALFFIKADGTFYRYLYGMVYNLRDFNFALIETLEGKFGSLFDRLTLGFKKYNAITGKYTD